MERWKDGGRRVGWVGEGECVGVDGGLKEEEIYGWDWAVLGYA